MPAHQIAFASDGMLRVDVLITPITAAMLAAGPGGLASVPRHWCRGLFDTGANVTCIPDSLVARLGLTSQGQVSAQRMGGVRRTDIYFVSLGITDRSLPGMPMFTVPLLQVGSHSLPDEEVIIGMDVIAQLKLDIDGPAATFTLEF